VVISKVRTVYPNFKREEWSDLIRTLFLPSVAYKCFVDTVPTAIDEEAIRGLERNLEQTLRDGLQLTAPDAHERCALMLQEFPAIATKRKEITRKLERLQAAKVELRQLSSSS